MSLIISEMRDVIFGKPMNLQLHGCCVKDYMHSPNEIHLQFICLSGINCVNSAHFLHLQTSTLDASAFLFFIFLLFFPWCWTGLACEHFDTVDGCGPAAVLTQPFICGSPDWSVWREGFAAVRLLHLIPGLQYTSRPVQRPADVGTSPAPSEGAEEYCTVLPHVPLR